MIAILMLMAVVSISSVMTADTAKVYSECAAEVGLTAAEVPKLKIVSFYEQDQRARCHVKCMSLRLGYIDTAGNLQAAQAGKAGIEQYNLDMNKVFGCIEKFKNEKDLCKMVYGKHRCVHGDGIATFKW